MLFEFTGASSGNNQFNAPTTSLTGGTVTNFQRTNVNWEPTANLFNSSAWNNGSTIDTSEHVGFGLTPNSGQITHLTSLGFQHSRSGSGPKDGSVRLIGGGSVELASASFSPTETLSTVAFNFTDLITADTVNIRFHGWNATSGAGTMRLDSVSLVGSEADFPAASANITLLANTTLFAEVNTLALSGELNGAFGLEKTGNGLAILAGANNYSGPTTISAGSLQVGVGGVGRTGTGNVTVNGSSAVLSGTGSVEGDLTVNQGTIKPGDNAGADAGALNTKALIFTPASSSTVAELQIVSGSSSDSISVGGNLTLNSFSNLVVNGTGYSPVLGHMFTLIDWVGGLTLGGFNAGASRNGSGDTGTNLDLPDISSSGYYWQISDMMSAGALTITVVPEPSRALLLLIGVIGMVIRRRR